MIARPNRPSPWVAPVWLALAAAPLGASCGGTGTAGSPAGPPVVAVEISTLEPKPVERTSEYLATVKSRRSTTVQPEVEGYLTRIHVRSGDRVSAGQVLMEIDSGRQAASVASLESELAALEAEAAYSREHAARVEALHAAGVASREERDVARAALDAREARVLATKERIREQKVELAYHRVSAPVAGVVGDVPARVGDRVTPSTALTTIDSNAALEAYLYVPFPRARDLRPGMPVRLIDESGTPLAETAIDFVSPKVEGPTQALLAKAPLAEGAGLRNGQIARARIVWSAEPGLTVPVVAVTRISGQFFAFVAEAAEGGTVARQRPLRLGPIVGEDYVVLDGLAAGERLIVSGVQKIGDGTPVDVRPAGAAAEPSRESGPPARG